MSDNIASMDSLLDSDLDSFADLPEFVTPPAGTYNATISFKVKEINSSPVIEISCVINATVELNDANATPVVDGSVASQAFFMANEFGQGAFKKVTKNLKEAVGATTSRQILEQCDGMEVILVSKTRKDKEDKERLYFSIVDMFPV